MAAAVAVKAGTPPAARGPGRWGRAAVVRHEKGGV